MNKSIKDIPKDEMDRIVKRERERPMGGKKLKDMSKDELILCVGAFKYAYVKSLISKSLVYFVGFLLLVSMIVLIIRW